MNAHIYEFPSGRRLDHLQPVPSPEAISPSERSALYADLVADEYRVEKGRRALELIGIETVTVSEEEI